MQDFETSAPNGDFSIKRKRPLPAFPLVGARKLVAGAGFEPTTSGFSPSCSSHLQLLPFYLLFREVSVYWRLLVFTADYQLLSPVLSPTFFTEIQGAPHSVYISPIRVVARVHVDVMPEIGCTHLGGYPSRDGPVIEHRAPVMGSH